MNRQNIRGSDVFPRKENLAYQGHTRWLDAHHHPILQIHQMTLPWDLEGMLDEVLDLLFLGGGSGSGGEGRLSTLWSA